MDFSKLSPAAANYRHIYFEIEYDWARVSLR
jgi:hypothetical protein